jgi:glycosyltransferase involved in cell wall biosynthesis
MDVLYLTMNPNRASTTVPTEGWFRELRPRGLRPVVASNEVGAFHEWAVGEGIPAYQVPLPFPSKRRPWPFLRSLWGLRRLVRRHGIQLVHCNEQDIYPIGKYLGRLCGLPVVVSVHFTMGRGYCEWAFAGRRCPDRMFFLSRGNQERCRPGVQGIVPESAWRLLPNGLDLDHYRPDAARREEFRQRHGLGAGPVVGVACALRPRKQLEHLFEAAARLPARVRVLLAGIAVSGDEAYADDLLRAARQRLGDRLVHVGHLDELRGFYNALDLFVNTSQEEACSISVLEAMACG